MNNRRWWDGNSVLHNGALGRMDVFRLYTYPWALIPEDFQTAQRRAEEK